LWAAILNKEFHSAAFTAWGGTLDMVQIWVNRMHSVSTADRYCAGGIKVVCRSGP
jgi:hypothetical protein